LSSPSRRREDRHRHIGDDGRIGERDSVRSDIEIITSGKGPDVLVGNDSANQLFGTWGADSLFGGSQTDQCTGDDDTRTGCER
jgi:serralysin